jgi:hypothetical protein
MSDIVKECHESWQRLHPDYTFTLLTRNNLQKYIPFNLISENKALQ